MSSKKWSTVLERKHTHMIYDAIHLVEDGAVHTMSMISSDDDDSFLYYYNVSEQEHNNHDDLSLSSLSSSPSSSSSSSSSSPSSSWKSISKASMCDEHIEDLLLMMQEQHQRISVNIHDPNIEWGCQLRLNNISNSKCIDNCRMRQDNLQHMFAVLWPKMRIHLEGHFESICCAYQYTACYETGFLVSLYRYSRPRRLSPDMEHVFGMRRSKLSAIIQTFSLALYHVSMPYLSDPSIWHQ